MNGVYAITPFTLLDFPDEIACIVWLSKCNLRCVYCHNPEIVFGEGKISEATCFEFLEKRKGQLTGVVFSGGEPTLFKDLPRYMGKARELGFKIKLDTNGSSPDVVKDIVGMKLVDYVALDYKCPANRAKELLGTDNFVGAFEESLAFLINARNENKLGMEIRTTFHADLMDEDDIATIINDLEGRGYEGNYYVQNLVSFGNKTIGNIAEPQRKMDVSRLRMPKNLKVYFRNFSGVPSSLEEALPIVK